MSTGAGSNHPANLADLRHAAAMSSCPMRKRFMRAPRPQTSKLCAPSRTPITAVASSPSKTPKATAGVSAPTTHGPRKGDAVWPDLNRLASRSQFSATPTLSAMHYHRQVPASSKHVPTLLVHGGAWAIPPGEAAAHEVGVRNALEAGYAVLARGGSSLDAVESAVAILEEDPTFDAGRGSFLTSDGRVQLDALLMDGGRMKAGGGACVERIRNPIHAARLVLEESPHVYFVGVGAEEFAQAHGMSLIDNGELVLDRERQRLSIAQARHASGLADETFSGSCTDDAVAFHDDKSPETAFSAATDHVPHTDSHDTVGAVADRKSTRLNSSH